MNRTTALTFSIFAIGGALLAGGCAQPSEQTWSTKPAEGEIESAAAAPGLPALSVPTSDLKLAAVDVLKQAAASESPLLRANAIEGLQNVPDALEPVVRQGLGDENRAVRFVAAMTVGQRKLQSIAHLLEPLLHDESESVQAAAMYGLKRCGLPADLGPLSKMIRSEEPEVRANAALVLGELGDRTAVPMIQQAVGQGLLRVSTPRVKVVELQMAEALVKLGQDTELQVIRAALFAPADQAELTALACLMCGRLNDARVGPDLVRLALRTGERQHSAEVRMAAAMALGQLGSPEPVISVPMEYVASHYPALRQQAALTLGQIGGRETLGPLQGLLADMDPLVQVAAATAIVQVTRQEVSIR